MDTHEVQPLQFMCLSKVAICIFNRTDIKKCIHELGCLIRRPRRHVDCIADRAKELASTLPLPASLKSVLMDVLRSRAIEVFDWYIKHRDLISYDFNVLSSFHWRPDGAIEELKTAQALVRRQDADIYSRISIACKYQLTADIQRLIDESMNMSMRLLVLNRHASVTNNPLTRLAFIKSYVSNILQLWEINFYCCICGRKDPRFTGRNSSVFPESYMSASD
ncbi:hypothetical protein CDAR_93451 [Caerostris darwini]|uniref:Uncharacterized protein n=1 Tax=Caerostris darwini TaxID=1538125 RepID=A0AAV4Q661_9ARAC|nr:hypothetical protein CDAR_93451 [Caerostris darwini]